MPTLMWRDLIEWLWPPLRYKRMLCELSRICDARGIGRDDALPVSVGQEIGLTDVDLREFKSWKEAR